MQKRRIFHAVHPRLHPDDETRPPPHRRRYRPDTGRFLVFEEQALQNQKVNELLAALREQTEMERVNQLPSFYIRRGVLGLVKRSKRWKTNNNEYYLQQTLNPVFNIQKSASLFFWHSIGI
jgi:hypothetical protein